MADSELFQIGAASSRRDVLKTVAAAVAAGSLTPALAQHVHGIAADVKKSGGSYSPKAFSAHEYSTIQKLADLIVPAEGSQGGALAAGAPEFIDLLSSENPELKLIWTNGVRWLDAAIKRGGDANFVSAARVKQTALLDKIAYHKTAPPEMEPGVKFFDWARKMTVDAYFTSAVGIKDLGFMGNTAISQFKVPAEVMDYVIKRSPV